VERRSQFWDKLSDSYRNIQSRKTGKMTRRIIRFAALCLLSVFVAAMTTSASYMCGDADNGGDVNIGDALYIIGYIFQGGAAPSPLEAGDADCGGDVNIGDALYIIAFIFQGGAPPCCPGPAPESLYVSAGFIGVENGSKTNPFNTLQEALDSAGLNALVTQICLSTDQINSFDNIVDSASDADITGGFTFPAWTPTSSRTVISLMTMPAEHSARFEIRDAGTVQLKKLEIVGSAAGGAGKNSEALFIKNSTAVILDSCRIATTGALAFGSGANGTSGAAQPASPNGGAGQNGTNGGASGGNGGTCPASPELGGLGGGGGYNTGNGASGSPGSGGAPGGAWGNASGNCFSESGAGGMGAIGANGANGAGGVGAASGGAYAFGPERFASNSGSSGTSGSHGKGGGGGGGGGGGASQLVCSADRGGGGGAGGAGGLGGNLGAYGNAGGSSVCITVDGSAVTIYRSNVQTGPGASGGAGGDGSAGGAGGNGGIGGSGPDDSGPGGAGGKGGDGGAGGPGGGGAGGASIGILLVNSGMYTDGGSNGFIISTGGIGGAGGTNPAGGFGGTGANGVSSAVYTL